MRIKKDIVIKILLYIAWAIIGFGLMFVGVMLLPSIFGFFIIIVGIAWLVFVPLILIDIS